MSTRPRVVIVGAGFAGINCARELDGAPVDVLVVDRHNFHTFQPLLYQVATAGLNAADVAYPVRGIFRRQLNVDFRHGVVDAVDWDGGELVFSDGLRERFDYLVVAAGSSTSYFGVRGAAEHAFPLYGLADATRLRNHVLTMFERADADPASVDAGALTFVVVGGGPTGVEMAGALVEVFETVLRRDYRRAELADARVVLVEMLPSVLPPFAKSSQRHAHSALGERGVEVRLGEQVDSIAPGRVRLGSGDEIVTQTVVWAAGVQANPLAGRLGLEQSKAGRVLVEPDLRPGGKPGVFVAGDLALDERHPCPQLAPVAIQQGRHAGRQIRRLVDGKRTQPFRYRDRGVMATIGRRSAVAELRGGIKLSGTIGWLAWLFLHLLWLVGFRNRLSVLVNWAWNYLAWDRGPRLILEPKPRQGAAAELRGGEHGGRAAS